MKRLAISILAALTPLVLSGSLIWCAARSPNRGLIGFHGGLLASATEPFLDGSGKLFQTCSWHLGNATRTRGETYGIKLGRLYLSVEIRHTNPRISPNEARE